MNGNQEPQRGILTIPKMEIRTHITRFPDNSVRTEISYTKYGIHGKRCFYHSNGRLRELTNYNQGNRVGLSIWAGFPSGKRAVTKFYLI